MAAHHELLSALGDAVRARGRAVAALPGDHAVLATHDGLVDPLVVALDGLQQAVVLIVDAGNQRLRTSDRRAPRSKATGRAPGSLAELDLAEPVGVAGPEIGVPPGGRAGERVRASARATREMGAGS